MKNFEKYFYHKLKNSQPPVDEQDWLDFQQRLYSQKKKRRGGFWIWSFASLVGIAAIVLASILLSDATRNSVEKEGFNKTAIQPDVKQENILSNPIESSKLNHEIQPQPLNEGSNHLMNNLKLKTDQSPKNIHSPKGHNKHILVEAAKELENKNRIQDNKVDRITFDEKLEDKESKNEKIMTSEVNKAKDSIPKMDTSTMVLNHRKDSNTKTKKWGQKPPIKWMAGIETGLYHWSGDSMKSNAVYIQPMLMAELNLKNFIVTSAVGYAAANTTYSRQMKVAISDSFPIYDIFGNILAWVKTRFRDTLVSKEVKGSVQSLVIPIEVGYRFKINSRFSLFTNVGVTTYIKSSTQLKYTDPISQQPVYPSTVSMAMIGQLSLSTRYNYSKHWSFQFNPVYFYVLKPEQAITGSSFKFQALYTF